MKLIVGLGNPGKEYVETRHNLGFSIIDQLVNKLEVELNKQKFNGLYYQTKEYIFLKPQTYMNKSGQCIASFIDYFQIPLSDLLVIYDDISLPLGKFRYRLQGSDGGHNGMKDIIEKLRTKNFKRLRIGVGYDNKFLIRDWVLGKFSQSENEILMKTIPILVNSLMEWIKEKNFEKIMSKFNLVKEIKNL